MPIPTIAGRNCRLPTQPSRCKVGKPRSRHLFTTIEGLPDTDPDAIVVRVRVALDKGDAATAETLLEKGPLDHPELARFRGRIALSRRDGPAALKAYRLAYKADPDHRDSVQGLAQALEMTGDSAAAKPLFEQARRHDALNTLVQRISSPESRKDPTIPPCALACRLQKRSAAPFPEAKALVRTLRSNKTPSTPTPRSALYRLKNPPETPRAAQ